MADKTLSLPEFLNAVKDGLKERVEEFEKQCLELRKKEAEALAKMDQIPSETPRAPLTFSELEKDDPLCASCSRLKKACKCELAKNANDYIDLHNENDPEKRTKTLSGGLPVVLPDDKKVKEQGNDEGSGGEPKKLGKDEHKPGSPASLKATGDRFSAAVSERQALSAKAKELTAATQAKIKAVKKGELEKAGIPSAPKPPTAPKSPLGMSNPGGTPKGAIAKDELAKGPPPIPAAAKPKPKVPVSGDLSLPVISSAPVKKSAFRPGSPTPEMGALPPTAGMPPKPKVKKSIALPGQKKSLPDLSGFQSLVPNKPKPAPDKTPPLPGVKLPGKGK